MELGADRETHSQVRETAAGYSAGARHFGSIGKVEMEEWSRRPNWVEMQGG